MTAVPVMPNPASKAGPSRFLSQLQDAAMRHGHSEPAAREIVAWCRRYILFHGKQHPQEMGRTQAGVYLDHVARTEKDPLRAIAAARMALEFLYGTYLQREWE